MLAADAARAVPPWPQRGRDIGFYRRQLISAASGDAVKALGGMEHGPDCAAGFIAEPATSEPRDLLHTVKSKRLSPED